MGFGAPTKLRAASEIAAAIGYIGLTNFDHVGALAFDASIRGWFPPTRGKGKAGQLFNFLENQQANGAANLTGVCKRVAAQARRSGVAIVISDFLLPEGYEAGLKTLAARGYEVTAIQVLDRNELEPDLVGDLKLVDAEDGSSREISVSGALLKTYKRNLDTYCGDLRAFCLRYGMNYSLVANDTPVETVMTRMLRNGGLVK
jgi:uncharacterized protein (DUF58 family)